MTYLRSSFHLKCTNDYDIANKLILPLKYLNKPFLHIHF